MAEQQFPARKNDRRKWLALGCIVLGAVGGWGVWKWRFAPSDQPAPAPAAAPEPVFVRPEFVSPFLNTKPGVKYVGDAACAECHAEIAATYRKHPMGRALAPVAEAITPVRYDAGSHNPFDLHGFHYSVERRDGRVFHTETRADAQGRVVAENQQEIHFALGSGTRGYSFLLNRDGYLYQSPISWFTQQQRWDLAPGYEHRNQHFERPISAACLFCHCNRAESAKDAFNRYETPIFQGHAIGCERCHGPGELHVKARQVKEGVDFSIVNPKHLEPALREGVCQQCHLQAENRVLRLGKELYDYRPGLPLHDFLSIFVRSPDLTDNYKAVSQVEQMHFSKCFKGSGGKLGCISCHDPHVRPAAKERVTFYRERCLDCHRSKGCSLPAPVRLQTSKEDSCIDCHMSRGDTPDIAHTALSDHRILRKTDKKTAGRLQPVLRPAENPLMHFHRGQLDPRDRTVGRELGIALVGMARPMGGSGMAKQLGGLALPRLDAALKLQPNDVMALDAKAYALWVQGRGREAIPVYEAALALSPRLEITLDDFALLLGQFGRPDEALARRKQIIEVNPWQSSYRLELAKLHAEGRRWAEAEAACREALRLNPALIEARTLLVKSLLQLGRREPAREEYERLLAFDPPNKEELKRWFGSP